MPHAGSGSFRSRSKTVSDGTGRSSCFQTVCGKEPNIITGWSTLLFCLEEVLCFVHTLKASCPHYFMVLLSLQENYAVLP
jgi:hypothetical protein